MAIENCCFQVSMNSRLLVRASTLPMNWSTVLVGFRNCGGESLRGGHLDSMPCVVVEDYELEKDF